MRGILKEMFCKFRRKSQIFGVAPEQALGAWVVSCCGRDTFSIDRFWIWVQCWHDAESDADTPCQDFVPSSQPRPSYSQSMQLLGGFEWILDFENLHQRSRLHWCRHRIFSASIHASQTAHSYLVALTLGGWVRLGRMSGKSRKLGPSHRTSCWMALHTPSVLSISCVRLVSWCRAGL